MIVGFTGSRKGLSESQEQRLLEWVSRLAPERTHHGDCVGADEQFHRLVHNWNVECAVHIHPPTDEKYRAGLSAEVVYPAAPFLQRDHDIVDHCDFLIGCPAGKETLRSGTWATIRYAKKAGKSGVIIYPDGSELRFGAIENE